MHRGRLALSAPLGQLVNVLSAAHLASSSESTGFLLAGKGSLQAVARLEQPPAAPRARTHARVYLLGLPEANRLRTGYPLSLKRLRGLAMAGSTAAHRGRGRAPPWSGSSRESVRFAQKIPPCSVLALC